MAKVKIGLDDHEHFATAAAAANTTISRWLTEAGRRRALADAAAQEQLWSAVVASISPLVESARQRACLAQIRIDAIVGSTVLLVGVDVYTRDVVELRLRPIIAEALSRLLGRRVQVAVTVDESRRVLE